MQTIIIPEHGLDNLPPPYFPPEATEVPDLLHARSNLSVPTAYLAPELTKPAANLDQPQPFKAVRIARAKTGQTELRLLAQQGDAGCSYIVRKASIAPYKHEDEPLKGGKKLSETRAIAEFGKIVAATYPPIELREDMVVPTHLDIL